MLPPPQPQPERVVVSGSEPTEGERLQRQAGVADAVGGVAARVAGLLLEKDAVHAAASHLPRHRHERGRHRDGHQSHVRRVYLHVHRVPRRAERAARGACVRTGVVGVQVAQEERVVLETGPPPTAGLRQPAAVRQRPEEPRRRQTSGGARQPRRVAQLGRQPPLLQRQYERRTLLRRQPLLTRRLVDAAEVQRAELRAALPQPAQ